MGGYSPGQCILHDSAATTTCSKTLITYITVTVPAPEQYGDSFVKAWAVEATVESAC